MSDKYTSLRAALEAMAQFGAWHKTRSHINIDESDEWCAVQIDVRANRDASRKVAGYLKEIRPDTIRALLAEFDALAHDADHYIDITNSQAAEIEQLRGRIKYLERSKDAYRADLMRTRSERDRLREAISKICALDGTESDEWDGVERVIPEMVRIARAALAQGQGESDDNA